MKKLSLWHLNLAKVMTGFYFSKIDINGERSVKPTLFIASHRNGATDGQVYTWAIGDTPSLISIQMLRKWFLRLIFDGIPVVRQQDSERYNISHGLIASPINQAIEQISSGGCLCLMPEGTSEWSYQPIPYKDGMAKIVAQLNLKNIDFDVQCIGVFYTKPDGFHSRVSIVLGQPFKPKSSIVEEIFSEMSHELNQVSVYCSSAEHFNQIQSRAWKQAHNKTIDYGQTFLKLQKLNSFPDILNISSFNLFQNIFKILFYIGFFPTVLFSLIAQKGADGRNNLTFFRLLGGFYGSIFTLIFWCILLYVDPIIGSIVILAGLLGWYYFPEPLPVPLKDNK